MSRRGSRRSSGLGPILGVGTLLVLIVGTTALVRTSPRDGPLAGASAQIAGTFGQVVLAPVRWVQGAGSAIGTFLGGATLNAKLKAENQSLLQWRDQAKALRERLEAYERLHGIVGEPLPQGQTGRVIGESSEAFSRTALVNLGRRSGIEVNWIVLNQNGLVGRVIAVGDTTSRILLLGDADSRVPVMGEETRARAMAIGDKSPAPRLAHLNTPSLMKDGERVVTSGDDGIFPRGLAVGQSGIAPDKQWRVRLASNSAPVDFVRLIPPSNFPLPPEGVTPPPLSAPPSGPSPGIGQSLEPITGTQGGVMPLAPGAAPIPSAQTPQAIREAQDTKALTKKLIAERDAARAAVVRAEAARKLAEERATRTSKSASQTTNDADRPTRTAGRPESRTTKKLDPSLVPVAPSALSQTNQATKTETQPQAEGPQ
jgi:rod shape-determining protein MreC